MPPSTASHWAVGSQVRESQSDLQPIMRAALSRHIHLSTRVRQTARTSAAQQLVGSPSPRWAFGPTGAGSAWMPTIACEAGTGLRAAAPPATPAPEQSRSSSHRRTCARPSRRRCNPRRRTQREICLAAATARSPRIATGQWYRTTRWRWWRPNTRNKWFIRDFRGRLHGS